MDEIDWHSLHTAHGPADAVPAAIAALSNAKTEEEARAAFGRLDNFVVLGNTLFDSAVPVIPYAQALTSSPVPFVREYAWEILIQIAGATDEDGSRRIEHAAYRLLRSKPELSRRAAEDSEPVIRHSGLLFAALVESDWNAVVSMAERLVDDPSPIVRELANSIREHGPASWDRTPADDD